MVILVFSCQESHFVARVKGYITAGDYARNAWLVKYQIIKISVMTPPPVRIGYTPYCTYSRETKGVGAGVAVGAGASSSVTGEYDEFDQMDAEEREEATSGTSHTVSWRKARAYLTAVLKTR